MNENETIASICADTVPRDHLVGTVYFVTCDHPDFPIKIGFASKIKPRIAGLKIVMPYPVLLLAAMSGSRRTERQLHIQLKESRLRGEWFRRSSLVMDVIERVIRGEPPRGIEEERRLQEHTREILKRAHML